VSSRTVGGEVSNGISSPPLLKCGRCQRNLSTYRQFMVGIFLVMGTYHGRITMPMPRF